MPAKVSDYVPIDDQVALRGIKTRNLVRMFLSWSMDILRKGFAKIGPQRVCKGLSAVIDKNSRFLTIGTAALKFGWSIPFKE
ncbi:hypothetical protein TNCV_64171 [Trichonephila clavipes]|nr:hypothetical protein TNCV_64171 [Trichonephila clavipes]